MTPSTAGLKIEGLHQILIIQNIAHELSSEQTILEFACKGLQDLPGVFKTLLIQGQNAETETSNDNGLSQQVFPVKARGQEYSKIIAYLEDPGKFLPYLPYVQNLCFYLATLIERQRLQKENDKYRADLEQKVQDRTKELFRKIDEIQKTKSQLTFTKNRLESLWNISKLTNESLQGICDNVLKEIVNMTYSPYGFYGFLDEDQEVMTTYSWSTEAMKDCAVHNQPIKFPIDKSGIWGNAVRTKKPFLLNDYQKDCEFKMGTPEGHVALTRVLSIPVISSGKVVAIGAVANKVDEYTKDDIDLLRAFLDNVQILIEHKKNEAELESYRENLQGLVNEQKQKLEETQLELLQNERLATLGQLTATVSHELRNPLGTIKSALFTIDDCIELNELQRASRPLELAERNINRCVNIIEELNAYAREKKLDISETNMNDWLNSMVDEIPIPDSIQIEQDFSCEIKVCFDQEKLRQVLINLINNAVHALQDEHSTGKKLLITCQVYDEQYEIAVSDNGIGMTDEVKNKMFEPLFSTKGFGLGLGMVIVKKIVEQHQGSIFIESQVGEGSTVTIRLPIALNR